MVALAAASICYPSEELHAEPLVRIFNGICNHRGADCLQGGTLRRYLNASEELADTAETNTPGYRPGGKFTVVDKSFAIRGPGWYDNERARKDLWNQIKGLLERMPRGETGLNFQALAKKEPRDANRDELSLVEGCALAIVIGRDAIADSGSDNQGQREVHTARQGGEEKTPDSATAEVGKSGGGSSILPSETTAVVGADTLRRGRPPDTTAQGNTGDDDEWSLSLAVALAILAILGICIWAFMLLKRNIRLFWNRMKRLEDKVDSSLRQTSPITSSSGGAPPPPQDDTMQTQRPPIRTGTSERVLRPVDDLRNELYKVVAAAERNAGAPLPENLIVAIDQFIRTSFDRCQREVRESCKRTYGIRAFPSETEQRPPVKPEPGPASNIGLAEVPRARTDSTSKFPWAPPKPKRTMETQEFQETPETQETQEPSPPLEQFICNVSLKPNSRPPILVRDNEGRYKIYYHPTSQRFVLHPPTDVDQAALHGLTYLFTFTQSEASPSGHFTVRLDPSHPAICEETEAGYTLLDKGRVEVFPRMNNSSN